MRFTLQTSDIARDLAVTEGDIARSVTAAMRQVTEGLKSDLRADVVDSGLGQRLANTWRGKTFPESGASIEAASFVWSKAPNIVDAFNRGVPIIARNRRFLAVPTPDAGVSHTTVKNKRLTPAIWETETGVKLRFVPRGRHALLVTDAHYVRQPTRWRRRKSFKPIRTPLIGGRRFLVIFVLVPMVNPGKRLDIEGIAQRWANRVGPLLAQHWR
mgnify:FL=1|jgi:hypothetical protein